MEEAAEGTQLGGAVPEGSADPEGAQPTEGLGEGQAATESAEEPVRYTVRSGGKEEQVTLDELTQGWMRQSDYTRKTQEVAAEKQRLAQIAQLADALDRDFQGTIQALANYAGLNFGQPAAAPAEELDPIEQLRNEFRSFAQQQQAMLNSQQEAKSKADREALTVAQIQSETARLKEIHGDFDQEVLWQYAADRQIQNLEVAFQAMQFEALQAQRIAEANAATEAKRRQGVVGGGHNSPAGATVRGAAGSKPSVREAFQMALDQSRS